MYAFQGYRITIQCMYAMCSGQSKVVLCSWERQNSSLLDLHELYDKALLWAAATTDLQDITTCSPGNCPSISAFLLVCLVAPISHDHCFNSVSMKVRFLQEYGVFLLVPGLFYVVSEPNVEWPSLKDTDALTRQSGREWGGLCQSTNKTTGGWLMKRWTYKM